jgi:hypothetical protein
MDSRPRADLLQEPNRRATTVSRSAFEADGADGTARENRWDHFAFEPIDLSQTAKAIRQFVTQPRVGRKEKDINAEGTWAPSV